MAIESRNRQPLGPLSHSLGGGVEAGTRMPTIVDPDLPTARRELTARHPEFELNAFLQRVTQIFTRLQEAWAEKSWEKARPYETDALFQVHNFWIERYRKFGQTNHLEDIRVTKIELARIQNDAFRESITVRIFASIRDWTEDSRGKIIGGSKSSPHIFSEYWTFIRSIGHKASHTDAWANDQCPSCGSPLNQVNMAGICQYCDSKITSGDYDWILSRIEQDEAYAG